MHLYDSPNKLSHIHLNFISKCDKFTDLLRRVNMFFLYCKMFVATLI